MKEYFQMFISFFKIGAFTIGGGYAMVPLIEREVVDNRKWIEKQEFIDMLALAQSAPGVLAVNTAIFVGYKKAGLKGAVTTTLGAVLPSFIIILLIATVFTNIKDSPVVERVFKGIRPAVVALIAVSIVKFAKDAKLTKKTVIIPLLVVIMVAYLNVTAGFIIVGAALLGIFVNRKEGISKK